MLLRLLERKPELTVISGTLEQPLQAFHYSGSLENAISAHAIETPYASLGIYDMKEGDYNILTVILAQRARLSPSPATQFGGRFNPQLLSHTEALADLVELHGSEEIATSSEKRAYKELKNGLFIRCTNTLSACVLKTSLTDASIQRKEVVQGVVEVRLPREKIRPGFYYTLGHYDVIEVPCTISSDYWVRIHIAKPHFRRVIESLDNYNLENIPVSELK